MADFDWNWPKKIERDLIERALALDFIREGRNLVLIGTNGLGKTMIAKNIAHQAVLAGFSVLCTTAAELIEDLRSCGPETLRRRLGRYTRPHLLTHRRGRLPRLRLARRRPALQGRRPPLRAARRTRSAQPLHPDHHEPRLRRLEHRLPQRHLDRHPPRQAHPPRRRHRDRGRELPRPREPQGSRRTPQEEAVTTLARQAYVDAVVTQLRASAGHPAARQPSGPTASLARSTSGACRCASSTRPSSWRQHVVRSARPTNLDWPPSAPCTSSREPSTRSSSVGLDPAYVHYLAAKIKPLVAEKDAALRSGRDDTSDSRVS